VGEAEKNGKRRSDPALGPALTTCAQLKKLINGVVAELESLGLGADVLRDLMLPPEGADGDDEDEESAGRRRPAAPASGTRHAPGSGHRRDSSGSRERSQSSEDSSADEGAAPAGKGKLRSGSSVLSPLIEGTAYAKRAESKPTAVPRDHLELPGSAYDEAVDSEDSASHALSSSPAAEWLSSMVPPSRARRHSSALSRGSRLRASGSSSSESQRADGSDSRDVSVDSESAVDVDDDAPVEVLRPRFKPAPGARRPSSARPSSSQSSAGASADDEAAERPWHGLGKKDLAALRTGRPSDVGGATGLAPRKTGPTERRASSGAAGDDERHDWGGQAWRERAGNDLWKQAGENSAPPRKTSPPPTASSPAGGMGGRWVKGKDGRRARAEYELGGTPEHPIPRIRLFVESPVNSDEEDGGAADDSDADDEDEARITDLPDSPRSVADTIRPAPAALSLPDPGLPLPPQDAADAAAEAAASSPADVVDSGDAGVHKRRMRHREIVIPLTADSEFLDTLTNALANLSSLQTQQRDNFVKQTNSLCSTVARVASPYASKSDLYVWREIFSLYVEMQIFESQREKDRGELSVDESEARLKRFAEELAKRGWAVDAAPPSAPQKKGLAKRMGLRKGEKSSASSGGDLPLKDARSVTALEDFLRLNLALLDVKKFQRVNVEAARKILKKHDKRTALTASSDLRTFMAQQEAARARAMVAGVGLSGLVDVSPEAFGGSAGGALVPTHPSLAALLPSSTTGLLSESLPHILLSLLTSTLLPILPSIDDYSCAICTGVAWRPIRLDCSHLFCIRCLVKLQKKGKVDCPLCRSKGVVGTADGRECIRPAPLSP
jgi:hypothetical protein